MSAFDNEIRDTAAAMEAAFEAFLRTGVLSGPGPAPHHLIAAMRHGTLNGGKRLRPLLARQSAAIFGFPSGQVTQAALALEMVHCYSLIHDDLPAMDDDDTRRGRPTVHIAYDEATAILAGDALLTHAFAILASPACHPKARVRIKLIAELAAGAGAGGMAGGQMRDLEGEKTAPDETEITTIQAMKTGALIRTAVRMGAILGGAGEQALACLTEYAQAAGRAFQIADDLLDVTASPARMGKATGKDAGRNKPTLVARIGVDATRRRLGDTIHQALTALMMFGPEADGLRETARYFAEREH